MICKECGNKIVDGIARCPFCDAIQENSDFALRLRKTENADKQVCKDISGGTNELQTKRKEKKRKTHIDYNKIFIAAVSLFSLVLVAFIAVGVAKIVFDTKSGYSFLHNTVTLYYSEKKDITYSVYGNTLSEKSVEGAVSGKTACADGTVVIAADEANNLYLFNKNEVKKIAQKVNDFCISPDGSAVCFSCGTLLYKYSVSSGSATELCNDFYSNVIFSYNGTHILYNCDYSEESKSFKLYLSDGTGRGEFLGRNILPIGVSDSGDCSFVKSESNNCLYSIRGEEKKKLAQLSSDEAVSSGFYFNNDSSEVMYTTNDETGICLCTGENVIIAKSVLKPLLPDDVCKSEQICGNDKIVYCGIPEFGECCMIREDEKSLSVLYNNSENKISTIVSGVDTVSVSADNSIVSYLKDGTLFTTSPLFPEKSEKIGACSYYKTLDDETVYYVNAADEMYVRYSGDSRQKVADDADSMTKSRNGRMYFISNYFDTVGGEMYYLGLDNDSRKVDVDVCIIVPQKDSVLYLSNYDEKKGSYTLCFADKDSKTKLLTGVYML